ncbi:MAG: amidohydrolase [Calditrichae bacterium]|nr:amidohydrolase [Calditrichia bacterium]
MQDLTVTIIQSGLHWEDPEKNLDMFSEKIDSIKNPTDLIVLPEMFTTGFSMNAEKLAESDNDRTLNWLKSKAAAKKADIIGSVIIKDQNAYFNRLFWVKKNGEVLRYDKRHLFRMADEHKIYTPGKKRLLGQVNGWTVCPLVCYDLRFPVWARQKQASYDVILYVANWPERRSSHWRLLLQARAVENQAYTIGVNRVGSDGLNIYYRGDSAIIDPLGNIIKQEADKEFIHTETLSWEKLENYRRKFPVWMDADKFSIDGEEND